MSSFRWTLVPDLHTRSAGPRGKSNGRRKIMARKKVVKRNTKRLRKGKKIEATKPLIKIDYK
jgi:hypothetical protein